MPLSFTAENHLYESLPTESPIEWISGTGILHHFKQPFDPKKQAAKSAKNKNSKWYGLKPETICNLWAQEAKRSTDDGTWHHDREEKKMIAAGYVIRNAKQYPVFAPIMEDGGVRKLAPNQRLVEGVYPEHLVYLKSAGICGQADIVERIGNKINIGDYKTNKKLDKTSYVNWEGMSQKMLTPVEHLDDCNFNHYALQLSLYMYMVLKHNPQCVAGDMIIYHVKFRSVMVTDATGTQVPLTDEYDFPIYERDAEGAPVVEEVVQHVVPYLKKEIESIIKWYTANRHKLPKKAKH